MSFSPLEYLRHMLVRAEFLIAQTRTLSKTELLQDEVLRRAVVRGIEAIGEPAKQAAPELRARHPEIDWRIMAGMRDRSIHGYFGIDYDIVWNVAAKEAVSLREKIERILAAEPGSEA